MLSGSSTYQEPQIPDGSAVEDGPLKAADSVSPVFLETTRFPFRELSFVIARDRRSRDPVYASHRWWARRPPSLMRALLISSILSASTSEREFWEHFASEAHLLAGYRVYDPFMGGGSTLVEASRLGAHVHGGDVDPVAVSITRRALEPADPVVLREAGNEMIRVLRSEFKYLYPDSSVGTPLHYFSIAEVNCPACGKDGPLYKNLTLVRDVGKKGAVVRDSPVTVFCPHCFELRELDSEDRTEFHCCGHCHHISTGTFSGQIYRCPHCETPSRHRDLCTGIAPRRLLAVEDTNPGTRRALRTPEQSDIDALYAAEERWNFDRSRLPHPSGVVHATRHDERPRSYGIERYEQMFTNRQLLVLGRARKWVKEAPLEAEVQDALELALSNALTTNNRLCGYATDYGRLSALFTVRGYSLPAMSVELNPLHEYGGRGTLAACIERVARSAEEQVRRHIWSNTELKPVPHRFDFQRNGAEIHVARHDAERLPLPSKQSTMDIVVFDPPYFSFNRV